MISEQYNNFQNSDKLQNIVLENRKKLTITGVIDVLSFDDQIIILNTELGMLSIKGNNLKINKLSIDSSEAKVDGEICSISYSDKHNRKDEAKGIFEKIFK